MSAKINAEWHRAHTMPKNATPQQRLDWHLAHAKACACRRLSAAQLGELKRAAKSE